MGHHVSGVLFLNGCWDGMAGFKFMLWPDHFSDTLSPPLQYLLISPRPLSPAAPSNGIWVEAVLSKQPEPVSGGSSVVATVALTIRGKRTAGAAGGMAGRVTAKGLEGARPGRRGSRGL